MSNELRPEKQRAVRVARWLHAYEKDASAEECGRPHNQSNIPKEPKRECREVLLLASTSQVS